MQQFAESRGGSFPSPQACAGLHYLVQGSDGGASSSGSGSSEGAATGSTPPFSGVLLIVSCACPMAPLHDRIQSASKRSPHRVLTRTCTHGLHAACPATLQGDARAAFPPDLGQGVNSALEDVDDLAQTLDATGDDLAAALPLYEQRRAPQIAALVQLMSFSFPWQYNQVRVRPGGAGGPVSGG